MLDVEQWAQIRRMKHVEGLSQREIRRRMGLHRDTIRRALTSTWLDGFSRAFKRPGSRRLSSRRICAFMRKSSRLASRRRAPAMRGGCREKGAVRWV